MMNINFSQKSAKMNDIKKTKKQLIEELNELKHEVSSLKKTLKKNKAKRKNSNTEKYKNLLKVVPDTIYNISPDGIFTYLSDSISALGYSPDELIGKHFNEIIHPEDIPLVSRAIVLPKFNGRITGKKRAPKLFDERRSGTRITRCLELRLIPKNWNIETDDPSVIYGSIFSCGEIDSTGHFFKNKSENPFLGTVGVIRDITDRKRLDEDLQKVEKIESIGVLAAGIAHDFNNILTAIIGNIILAKMSIPKETETFEVLADAEKASLRAKDLTKQLLTFSKGGAPVKNPTSIVDLLKETTEFALRGSNVKHEIIFDGISWKVNIDESQISQVINNLLINSCQAMPEGGKIDIKIENITLSNICQPLSPGKYVKISIRDYGLGIPRDIIKKIFDPYFTTKEEGNGLGLTTSYSIIKRHEGYIAVDSEPDLGTVFHIYLQAADSLDNLNNRQKKEDKILPAFSGRIMIIDEDDEILEVTSNLLKNIGFETTPVKDEEEAIQLFKNAVNINCCFDIIIIDLKNKGSKGPVDLMSMFRELVPDIKIVIACGYSDDKIITDYHDYGFDGLVTKPFVLEDLVQTINEILYKN